MQEAKAASALNHPNIIPIYDIDTADGVDFIAMEYVAGKTLDQVIGRKGVKLNEALGYAVQIADGLAKAHAAGIVHRDLKPSNIMVTEDGVVKLLDFGGRPVTEEGTIVGTVAYMSLEQAEGKKVDARSDIFSFGSVFYEMLTGQRAFQGEPKVSTLAAILHKEPKPTSEVAVVLPPEVERAMARCLRKDPQRRWQNMSDLKVLLQDLKEEPESGKLSATMAAAPARRHYVRALLPAVLVIIVAAGGLAWWLSRRPATPEELQI